MEVATRAAAALALERFRDEFEAKYPKALAKLDRDWKHLTAFDDFPAEHWRHLRTSNATESSFATVKAPHAGDQGRREQKGRARDGLQASGGRPGAVAWYSGHDLVADVLAGAKFKDGIPITEDDNDDNEMTNERWPPDPLHSMSSTTFANCSQARHASPSHSLTMTKQVRPTPGRLRPHPKGL